MLRHLLTESVGNDGGAVKCAFVASWRVDACRVLVGNRSSDAVLSTAYFFLLGGYSHLGFERSWKAMCKW